MSMLSEEQMTEAFNKVRAYVSSCPPIAIKLAINSTVEEFARETASMNAIVRINLANDCKSSNFDGHTFSLVSPFGGRVDRVDFVRTSFGRIGSDMYRDFGTFGGGHKIIFNNDVRHYGFIDVGIGVQPTDDMDGLPDEWWSRHKNAIVNGTIVFMLSQTGKPYGDEAMAALFLAKYKPQVQDATFEARTLTKGNGNTISAYDETMPWAVF